MYQLSPRVLEPTTYFTRQGWVCSTELDKLEMLGLLKHRDMDRRWQGKDQVFQVFYDAEARGGTSTYFFVLACTWRSVSVHNSRVRLRGSSWNLPKIHLWIEIFESKSQQKLNFCFCISTDMKFSFQSYDQYEIPWSKDRRRDGLRDVNVSMTTSLLPTQVQPTQLKYQFFYAISSWFSLLIRGNCYLPEQMTQIDSYSHSSYSTDVKILQRNLKFYQRTSTDIERTRTDTKICQRILKFSQLKLNFSQQTLKFCWQDSKWPKFCGQDSTEIKFCCSRSNRKWKFVNKTNSRLNRNEILFPRFKMTEIFRFKTEFQTLDITWTSSACHSDTIFLFTAAQLKPCQRRIEYYAARKTNCIFSEAHNFGSHHLSKLKLLLDNLHYLDYLAHTSTVVFRPWKGHFGRSERSIYTGTQFWEVTTSCTDLPTLDTHCGPL